MKTIKTRREAADAGESKYYTGKPCKNGHDGMRYTASGICCKCNSDGVKKYAGRLNAAKVSRAVGAFVHNLHPDDHAAARAYCQALDLQRGRTPWAPPVTEVVVGIPFDAVKARELALGKCRGLVEQGVTHPSHPPALLSDLNPAAAVVPSGGMSPEMEAQLRAAGLLS